MNKSISATLSGAIRHPRHLIAVAAVTSASVALLDIRPIEAGLAAEMIYLTIAVVRAAGIRVRIAAEDDGGATSIAASTTPAATSQTSIPPILKTADPAILPDKEPFTDEPPHPMHPLRLEQLARVDANLRLIAMRLEDGSPAFGELALSLGRLRDKFVLFASNEVEHETRLRRYSDESLDDEKRARRAPATGADAFAPSMMALTHADIAPANSSGASDEMRQLVRELLARYDWQMNEITWQRDQLPAGSEAGKRLDQHAATILRRRKYADRAATVLNSLHYEMELIVRKCEAVNAEVVTRQPGPIISDINALLIQAEAVTRSLTQLETGNGTSRTYSR